MEKLQRVTIKPVLLGEIKKIAEQKRESVSGIINRYLEEVLFEKKRAGGFRNGKKHRLNAEQAEKAYEELSKIRKGGDGKSRIGTSFFVELVRGNEGAVKVWYKIVEEQHFIFANLFDKVRL